ncbi:MAG: methylenetetrahydrofolate reductase [Vampirovibrionales bacterium]|nr:methylenetetrahydrofolate reductase [Vampirovibrionales bacterium]
MLFSEKLAADGPLITVELSPPRGTDVSSMLANARALQGRVDAINVPDCQRSILKMSSLAAAALIESQTGIETVWQLTCRDRNLIALQADLMGAWALGLRTVLALTGDPVQVGDQKDLAAQVFHLESTRLIELIRGLNQGVDAIGVPLKKGGSRFTVGSALNLARLSKQAQRNRLRVKLEKGVDFFQTQPVYDLAPILEMREIMTETCAQVGCAVPKVLVGIVPPSSAKAARFMNEVVTGIQIPQAFIDLLERSEDPKGESLAFCADVVARLAPHCDGFHFMPVAMERRMPDLLDRCFPAPVAAPSPAPARRAEPLQT